MLLYYLSYILTLLRTGKHACGFLFFSFLLTFCLLRRRVAEDHGTVLGLHPHRAFDELACCWILRFYGLYHQFFCFYVFGYLFRFWWWALTGVLATDGRNSIPFPLFLTIKLHISALCIRFYQLPVKPIIQACINKKQRYSSRQTDDMHATCVLWLPCPYLDLAFGISPGRSSSFLQILFSLFRQTRSPPGLLMADLYQSEQDMVPCGSKSPCKSTRCF